MFRFGQMSSSDAPPSLADRLVTACANGDIPSAEAAVADGASVNEEGKPPVPAWAGPTLPLKATRHVHVVVWLLSHGADPNGDRVMEYGACSRTAEILQLLIDAGGDVNRDSGGWPPLLWATGSDCEDNVRVLLAQPCLDLDIEYDGNTPEQCARDHFSPVLAELIAHEVSVVRSASSQRVLAFTWCLRLPRLVGRGRDELRWYDHRLLVAL